MEKMKVIDLLNKIAKDEHYRPTVKFEDKVYKYSLRDGNYGDKYTNFGLLSDYKIDFILNDEVEIIEEENGYEQRKKVVHYSSKRKVIKRKGAVYNE